MFVATEVLQISVLLLNIPVKNIFLNSFIITLYLRELKKKKCASILRSTNTYQTQVNTSDSVSKVVSSIDHLFIF